MSSKFVPFFKIRMFDLRDLDPNNLSADGFLQGPILRDVKRVTYEDHADALDEARIELDNAGGKYSDNPLFFEGNTFTLSMGYSDNVRYMNDFQIAHIDVTFAETERMVIIGEEMGALLKNTRAPEIRAELAALKSEAEDAPEGETFEDSVVRTLEADMLKEASAADSVLQDNMALRDSVIVKRIIERNMKYAKKEGYATAFNRYYIMKTETKFSDGHPYFSNKPKFVQKPEWSDWKMLRELAKRNGFVLFVRDKVLFFMLPKMSDSPLLQLEYRTGKMSLKKFTPSLDARDMYVIRKSWLSDNKEVPVVSTAWMVQISPLLGHLEPYMIPYEERDAEAYKKKAPPILRDPYTRETQGIPERLRGRRGQDSGLRWYKRSGRD